MTLKNLRNIRKHVDTEAFPSLVSLSDIKGDLHTHSLASDGRDSLLDMAEKAVKLGYEYIASTDHSAYVAPNGMNVERLLAHIEYVEEVNTKIKDVTVLKGIEVDILEDGSLDMPDNVLEKLDIVVCSLHAHFNLSKEKQTTRILKAMDNPNAMIIGHPTGKMTHSERFPYELDRKKIIEAAADKNIALELSSSPVRRDLPDDLLIMAKEMGVKISIDSDSHDCKELENITFGVARARRNRLSKEDIVNTLSLHEMLQKVQRR